MSRISPILGLLLVLPGWSSAASELSRAELERAAATPIGETVSFSQVPLALDRGGEVRMKRIDIYAEDARILLADDAGYHELPRSDRLNFVADRADPGSPRLGLSMAADGSGAEGVLYGPDGKLYAVLGTAFAGGLRFEVRAADRDASGRPADFTCDNDASGRKLTHAPDTAALDLDLLNLPGLDAASRSAVVAVDTDVEFMAQKFSDNTTNASNYLAALFTGMNVIYERDLDLTLLQGTTILRTTALGDPYSATETDDQLDEFGEEWAANQTGVTRAFAMLLSGKSPNPNSSAGIAWVLGNVNYCNQRGATFPGCSDGTCTFGHYSVSQVFKFAGATAASDLLVIPHEIGHNFGANHTHCSDATTGGGPQANNTIDICFNTEPGCFSGTKVCPAPSTVNGVPNVTGTLMSYCHLSGLANCGSSQVFATAHRTLINPRISNNVTLGCFANTAATNQAPTLNAINNPAAILEDAGLQTVNLSGIGDGDAGSTQNLSVSATSSMTGVIPNPTVSYTSPSTTGSISYTPVANQSGNVVITVTVTDDGGTSGGGVNTVQRQFTAAVTPVNDAPTLNAISNPAPIAVNAGQQIVNLSGIGVGPGDPAQTLTITAVSNTPGLIPNPTVTYTSPNTTGSITFTPLAGQSGSAMITVTVTDNGGTANGGVNSVSRSFTQSVGVSLFANGFE